MSAAKAAVCAAGGELWAIDRPRDPVASRGAPTLSRGKTRSPITEALLASAVRVLENGCQVVSAAKVDGLIVDQSDLAAGSVAELLGLPYVSLLTTYPPFYRDDDVPPTCFGWQYREGAIWRFRNRLGNAIAGRTIRPVLNTINECRRHWGLPSLRNANEAFSKLALLSQIPEALDFPRLHRPKHLHYIGLLDDGLGRQSVEFPWDRLSGKPLVYATLGTIHNSNPRLYALIAEACAGLQVQLVIDLGGGQLQPEDITVVDHSCIVTHFAPHRELLNRAHLAITHAGVTTTLEALSSGVPMVTIPSTFDQHGLAARVVRTGSGIRIPAERINVARLRKGIMRVLEEDRYRDAARAVQREMCNTDAPGRAADIVEQTLIHSARQNGYALPRRNF